MSSLVAFAMMYCVIWLISQSPVAHERRQSLHIIRLTYRSPLITVVYSSVS